MSRARHPFHPNRGAEPVPAPTWEEQKAAEARAYLEGERGKGQASGAYLPTVEGEINAGRLAWSDLTPAELTWVLDEQEEFRVKAGKFPGGDEKGTRESEAMIAAALAALQAKGGSWTPAVAPLPFKAPPPPPDPSRGR